jgi:hypothetical protein
VRHAIWIAVAAAACGSRPSVVQQQDAGSPVVLPSVDAGPIDAGPVDAGPVDAGPVDAGPADAGPADAGQPDAGMTKLGEVTTVPNSNGWDFRGSGLPSGTVMGASMDEGGNLWVAGGNSGVYVQSAGTQVFRGFGIGDGLHPYGWLNGQVARDYGVPDGTPADKSPSLDATPVVSVSAGPAGTAWVGYQGKGNCEDEWDRFGPTLANHEQADPSIYKSGDADKVTLSGGGIAVAHYDIFSGPGVVGGETLGREKLCSIWRILYDKAQGQVWFGGNHGFAMGFADYNGDPTCDGQLGCSGVFEHVHPAINDISGALMTDAYYGIAIDPVPHAGNGSVFYDVWFGGMIRTTRFRFGEQLGDFFTAGDRTQTYASSPATAGDISSDEPAKAAYWNRMDVWPDPVGERRNPPLDWTATYPDRKNAADWNFDNVSAIAAMKGGDVWIASSTNGLRHLDHDGKLIQEHDSRGNPIEVSDFLPSKQLGAIARDPTDESLWMGYRDGHGVTRMMPDGSMLRYDSAALGGNAGSAIWDIQIAPGTPRKVLVAFRRGAVGVYSGP